MKDNKLQLKAKSTSQILYRPPAYTQTNLMPNPTRPPGLNELNDRQLLKQQFYLSRFIKTLEANSTMPTLPNQALLVAIRKQNYLMQQKVQALRHGNYEQYLLKILNNLSRQAQMFRIQSQQSGYETYRGADKKIYEKQTSL